MLAVKVSERFEIDEASWTSELLNKVRLEMLVGCFEIVKEVAKALLDKEMKMAWDAMVKSMMVTFEEERI